MTRKPSRRRCLSLAVTGVVGLLAASHDANAGATTWNNSTGNNLWNDPANWTQGVPTAADDAVIAAPGTITLPDSPPANALSVRRAFSGSSSPLTLQSGQLLTGTVGPFGIGTITLNTNVASPSDALVLQNTAINGTVGGGPSNGAFDVLLISSSLNSAATTNREAIVFGSSLSGNGSFAQASLVNLVSNVTLTSSPATTGVDRLPNNSAVALNNATFVFNAGASDSTTNETSGDLRLAQGSSILRLNGPSTGSLTYTAASLQRNAGTTLHLTTQGDARLRLLTLPTGPNGAAPTDRAVLGYGFGSVTVGSDGLASFLTYDTGANASDPSDDVGLRPLDWNTEYATSVSTGGNVRLSGLQSFNGANANVRSLNLTDGNITLGNTSTLNVATGLILQSSTSDSARESSIVGNGTVNFGAAEAVVYTFGGTGGSIWAPIHAAGAFTKSGPATLYLARSLEAPGGLYIAGGTLETGATGGLGVNGVTFTGPGTLRVDVSQTIHDMHDRAGFVKQTSTTSYHLGSGNPALSTAAGVILDVNHFDGNSFKITGEGVVHLVAGGDALVHFAVDSGELRVDGDVGSDALPKIISLSNFSTLFDGGKVGGSGRLHGNLSASARRTLISPGDGLASAGHLTVDVASIGSSFIGNEGPALQLNLNGVSANDYDQLIVLNTAFVSQLQFDVHVGFTPQLGDVFTVLDNRGLFAFGAPANNNTTFTADGYQFRINYLGGDGNDITLTVVPEPAAGVLTFLAVGVFGRRRRVSRLAQR